MKRRGFTVLEMLFVISIVVLLLALIVPAVNRIGAAQSLTNAAAAISDHLAYARQTALAQNRVVEARFYKRLPRGDEPGRQAAKFRAFSLVIYDEQVLNWFRLTDIRALPPRIIISDAPEFSTLITEFANTTPPRRMQAEASSDESTPYQSIKFRPDGSTDLSPTGAPGEDKWFLTIVPEEAQPAGGKPGSNYACLMIDPASGRVRVFRP